MTPTIRVVKTHRMQQAQGNGRDVTVGLALIPIYPIEVSLAAFTNLEKAEILCFTESCTCTGEWHCDWCPALEVDLQS